MKRPTHQEIKQELLNDRETFSAYHALEEEYQLMGEMVQARKRAGLTQDFIAKEMKTTASAVSRLESLHDKTEHSPSLKTLRRYAHAVGCVLKIELIPKAHS